MQRKEGRKKERKKERKKGRKKNFWTQAAASASKTTVTKN